MGTVSSPEEDDAGLPEKRRQVSLFFGFRKLIANLTRAWCETVADACADMDFLGLLLIAASLALILLPLGLAPTSKDGWRTPSMVSRVDDPVHPCAHVQPSMIIVGVILFPIFIWYEHRYPRSPVVPMRWLHRGPILGACLIGFFDFASFYLQGTYLYS